MSDTSLRLTPDTQTFTSYFAPIDHEDELLVSRVKNLFYRARDHRRSMVQQWNKNYKLLTNKFWTSHRPSYLPRPELPEIFPIVASFVGWMTDQRPSFTVTPWSLPYSPYHARMQQMGEELSVIMRARWDDDDMEASLEQIIWDSQIYGTGIAKVGWQDWLQNGKGDAVLKRIDNYTFYPDPQATNITDGNYYIEARTMSLQELDRTFPGSAKYFQGGFEESVDSVQTQVGPRESMPMANPGAISPATTSRYSLYGQSRLDTDNYDDAGVTVFECWIREHYIDKQSGVIDGWRCIVVAGNRVLFNEPATNLWEHGQHPYERYVPYDLGEFWGISLVELLASPQESLNRILAALQQNIELLGNPVFKESTRSGLTRTKVTNQPGQRVSVNQGADADWMKPPPLHEMIPDLMRYFLARMEAISGLSAINRGQSPSGRNSSDVIESMQEAGFVRVRMALRNEERFLRKVGNKLASIIVENYTVPRMVAYTGPDGSESVFGLKSNNFYLPTGEGEDDIPMKFRLKVDVGSQNETSREARKNAAMTLYTLGAIDDAALLEVSEFPNWQKVWQRVQESKAAGLMQPPGARQRAQRTS